MTADRGDIVWVSFNPRIGHEQSGRRPALVISPAAYNAVSNCMIVCPITSNIDPWPWKVVLPDGARVSGAVLVDQVKSIDVKARGIAADGARVAADVLDEVLARLATLTA